jgi:two-component system, cell cycle sensor histidine kinase and response regulator CckA
MKILLVDDIDANLMFLEMLLGSQGHETIRALNGQEALLEIRKSPPDLIISDILMPVMDGYALCRACGEDPRFNRIPFVFFTATYLSDEDEAFALSLGAAAFLRKPMEPEAFLDRIQGVIHQARDAASPHPDAGLMDEGVFLKLYNERLVQKLDQRSQLLAQQVEELQRAESRLQLQNVALEATANCIVITDRQGSIEWVNAAFLTTMGFTSEEVIGKNPRIMKSGNHEHGFYKRLWDTILTGQVWRGEIVNRKKDGTLRTFQISITPLRDKAGDITHFIDIMQDVSDQKRMEDELRQAQKMEAIGRLAGGVAHDFNNMLNVILVNSELSLMVDGLTDKQRNYMQQIQQAAERSADLTRQLLAFSRKQPAQPRCIDLNEVVRDNQGLLNRFIEGDVELSFRPAPVLPPVFIDPSQVIQILTNLVINARDAMPSAGTISIETAHVRVEANSALTVWGLTPGSFAQLTVSDTGSGMDAQTIEHIFEPFFTTKGEGKGTGLGLATVYGIVKQNGGAISVYSNLGLGTSMKIYLPDCGQALGGEEPEVEALIVGGDETILVAEDETMVRNVIRTVLESRGYSVLTAESPLDTVMLAKEHRGVISLLITDVVMPGINGKDLQSCIAREIPDIKVLFISGYTGDILSKRGLILEETNFLQKPFNMVDLALKVREVLDQEI